MPLATDTTESAPAISTPLPRDLQLVCPKCRVELERESNLRCPECSAEYPVIDGVLHFVDHDKYADAFSFEWELHSKTFMEETERLASERILLAMEVTPELVKGKIVLDAGCGMGRFTEILTRWGAEVVAVDMSESVHVARQNLENRAGASFIQADIFHLPFPEGAFDVILSWGVLHHTPDCAAAFRALARHTKPGGTLAVYIYGKSKGMRRRMITFYRHFTPHIPKRLLYAFCRLARPMYYAYKIPILGNLLRFLIPMSRQKNPRFRVLETFDEYAPRYASRHPFPEVFDWFRKAGFTDIRIFDPPVRAIGTLPSTLDRTLA